MFNCDVASATGKGHRICQDYARCNTFVRQMSTKPKLDPTQPANEIEPPFDPYVLVADGCSSSEDSDFGARLLVKLAEKFLYRPHFHESAVAAAWATASSMCLPENSLDATLLTATLSKEAINVTTYGDGVVAVCFKNGSIRVFLMSYGSGYPYYLSYSLNEKRNAGLLAQVKADGYEGNPLTIDTYNISETGEINNITQITSTAKSEQFAFPIADTRFVAIMSDGVQSFIGADEKSIPAIEIVKKLLTLPRALRGEFVQRRMNAFLTEATAAGWRHVDDLSMGIIHLGV